MNDNRMNFTKKRLDSIPNPESGKRPYYHDTEVKGLLLRVTDKGVKSFIVQRRINGKVTRITLGRYPDMTIQRARSSAIKTLGDISDGINPNLMKRANENNKTTLSQVLDDYVRTRGTNLKESTIKNYRSIFNSYLSEWGDRMMVDITRNDVEQKHRAITEKSPTRADTTMRILSALYTYAGGEYEDVDGKPIVLDNPVNRLSHVKAWNKVVRRQNVIKPHELKNWYQALQKLPESRFNKKKPNQADTVKDLLVFILLTGLRRREATNLTWGNIDFQGEGLTIHNTKNRKSHSLPLTSFLLTLLKGRKASTHSIYVFEGMSPNKPINDPKKQVAKVREISGIHFTLHDLRRTFATIADSLEMSQYALKKLLNHSDDRDVTVGYIISDIERLRKPMQLITNYFLEQIK